MESQREDPLLIPDESALTPSSLSPPTDSYPTVSRLLRIYQLNVNGGLRRNPLVRNKGRIRDDWTLHGRKQSTMMNPIGVHHSRNLTQQERS